MVVSPCTTFTLPEKVASFFLSRISSVAASIWIGWSRFCENPCIALGTPVTALCAPASPAAITASANATEQAPCAIRLIGMRGGKILIMESFRVCGLAGYRSRLGGSGLRVRRGRGAGGLIVRTTDAEIVEIHHDIAYEPRALAASGDPEPVGGQRPVQQFDID